MPKPHICIIFIAKTSIIKCWKRQVLLLPLLLFLPKPQLKGWLRCCRCVTVEHFLKVNDLWGWWWWHSDHKITLAAVTRGVKSPIQSKDSTLLTFCGGGGWVGGVVRAEKKKKECSLSDQTYPIEGSTSCVHLSCQTQTRMLQAEFYGWTQNINTFDVPLKFHNWC